MHVIPPHDGYIGELDLQHSKGVAVDVPDAHGQQLVAQGWKKAKPSPPARGDASPKKKAAAKSAAKSQPDPAAAGEQ